MLTVATRLNLFSQELRHDNFQFVMLLLVFLVSGLLTFAGLTTIPRVASLYSLAEAPNPHFIADFAILLYVWTPLVSMGTIIFMMAPGMALSLAFVKTEAFTTWLISSFAISLILVSATAAVIQELIEEPLDGISFFSTVSLLIALSVCCLVAANLRNAKPQRFHWRQFSDQQQTIVFLLLGPIFILIALSPKFYWENFNGDGAHTFEAARLLLNIPLPFFEAAAGGTATFPGMTSFLFIYPASWFVRLFGEIEYAVRLPLLLYLPLIYALVSALVQHGRPFRQNVIRDLLIWGALSVYTLALGYSATYNPFFADIALPATQDTLLMVCFLSFVLFRGGSVCLNNFRTADKWISAPVMPRPGLVAAR